jgi:hypothetical protein
MSAERREELEHEQVLHCTKHLLMTTLAAALSYIAKNMAF